jgi:hypothetical protein
MDDGKVKIQVRERRGQNRGYDVGCQEKLLGARGVL